MKTVIPVILCVLTSYGLYLVFKRWGPSYITLLGTWVAVMSLIIGVSRKILRGARWPNALGSWIAEMGVALAMAIPMVTAALLVVHIWEPMWIGDFLRSPDIRFVLVILAGGNLAVVGLLVFKIGVVRAATNQSAYVAEIIRVSTRSSAHFCQHFSGEDHLTKEALESRWRYLLRTSCNLTDAFFSRIRHFVPGLYGARSAWLIVPDRERNCMRVAYFHGPVEWESALMDVKRETQLSFYDPDAFDELTKKLERKEITPDEFDRKKKKCISAAGYIFWKGNPKIYNDLSKCTAFHHDYLRLIPPDLQDDVRFMSLLGVRLTYLDHPVGVLMVLASKRRFQFFGNDLEAVKPLAAILGSLVGYGMREGVLSQKSILGEAELVPAANWGEGEE
jgi:hypothetical protein